MWRVRYAQHWDNASQAGVDVLTSIVSLRSWIYVRFQYWGRGPEWRCTLLRCQAGMYGFEQFDPSLLSSEKRFPYPSPAGFQTRRIVIATSLYIVYHDSHLSPSSYLTPSRLLTLSPSSYLTPSRLLTPLHSSIPPHLLNTSHSM